jgi:hypothetical protein
MLDWSQLIHRPFRQQLPHIKLRGRNFEFIESLLGALQMDRWNPALSYSEFKRAFTPQAIRQIYEAIPVLWPNYSDYSECMKRESSASTALYTGSYEPSDVFKALCRHSLYTDRIFLTDPFLDPRRVREQFSPLVHPEQHRSTTIKWSRMWLELFSWIDAGLVNFIRPPADFIPGLWDSIYLQQKLRFEKSPELKKLSEDYARSAVEKLSMFDGGVAENYFLHHQDDYFRQHYAEMPDPKPSLVEFLQFIQRRRENHPYFMELVESKNGEKSEILMESTGACYDLSKVICEQTNSHIITNLPTRWKEIELDRHNQADDLAIWSPFAKALQNADLKILNSTSLDAALMRRSENRLEGMRLFFRRVWNASKEPEDFSESNALNLAGELKDRIGEAKSEWEKIDQDLIKWVGGGMSAMAAVVGSGMAGFVPVATAAAVGGITSLVDSHRRRVSLRERFPAAFFLGLKN